MKLEGIHHITAITGDAQRNVDFYAGTLGLRMVKKTVNQDEPSVYHLFYADEKGSPGADLTFFEFRGAPEGRAGAGMVHRIVWRVASEEALGFWAERLEGAGIESERTDGSLVFADPEGLDARARGRRDRRRAADRRPPGGPARGRAPGLPRGAGLLGRPRRRARGLLESPGLHRRGLELGGARIRPRRPLVLRRAARAAGARGRGHRPPHRLGVADGRARGLAPARDRGRRPPDAGDRPLLVPLDLLPRAERRAVRGRDPRPGLRHRRGSRAPGGEA